MAENTKHTPGSWHAVFDKMPSPFYIGLVALIEGSGRDGNAAVVTDGRECRREEWHANARLIAAAPELLAALKFAVQNLAEIALDACRRQGLITSIPGAIEKAQRAITKAEGKE